MARLRLRPWREIAEGLFGLAIVLAIIVVCILITNRWGPLAPGLAVVGIALLLGFVGIFVTTDRGDDS